MRFGESVTLERLIHENIYSNPQVKEALFYYRASQEELKQATASLKPTLDLRAEMGKERTEIAYSFDGKRDLNERQIALVGRYNLFDGFKTTHSINEKRAALQVSRNKLLEKINTITALMIEVYLELLRRKALLEIEEQNYQNHLETLEKVRLRLEAGDGYESDYRQTKARVKLAQTNRLIAKRYYLNAKINYQKLLGSRVVVEQLEMPIVFLKTDDSEQKVALAKEKNFALQAQKMKIQQSHFLYEQEKSRYYPTLDLELSQSWNNNVHGFEGKDNSQKLALVLNYNLYNGGADEASTLAALKRTQMQKEGLDEIKLGVEEEVRIALMRYQLFAAQLELNAQQLTHLLGTRELYELEYQNSKRTIIDVLNIKQEYSYAQAQKINAQYDQLLAYYQYKRSVGELIEEFHLDNLMDSL